jgi:alkylhydroperoxidase family enzyme
MLAYVEKLTLRPGEMVRDDVDALRAAGFDDRAITQIAGIASMFAYLNRMADGLGTGRT